MAFVDGEAEPALVARINTRLAQDEALLRRVEVYRSTGKSLGALYDAAITDPIPDRIVDVIRAATPIEPEAGVGREAAARASLGTRLWTRVTDFALLRPLVLTGTAIAGIAVGWLAGVHLGGVPGAAWRPELVASGPMRQVLDATPSGTTVELVLADGSRWTVRPTLSFRDKDGGYCRQYEMASTSSHGLAGLYCRGADGTWRSRVQVVIAAQHRTAKLAPAAGPGSDALEAAVDKLIDGEALSKPEEETAIAAKWNREKQ